VRGARREEQGRRQQGGSRHRAEGGVAAVRG
jgi:hypothetical protein